jgi:hypothetical protein
MSIKDLYKRIKGGSVNRTSDDELSEVIEFDEIGQIRRHGLIDRFFLSLVIILVAMLSFGLGRLYTIGERAGVVIEYDPSLLESALVEGGTSKNQHASSALGATREGSVVVSSKGTKYHYAHCSGAKQIKEENRIIFVSAAEAEQAGYSLAANCKPK